MPSYSVHGLKLDSNVAIEGLPLAGDGPVDVAINFGSLPKRVRDAGTSTRWYESTEHDEAGEPSLRIRRLIETGELWLRYADGTQFLIDASASSVFVAWPPEFTIDDAIVYLLGPVLGILLRIRGRACLHASVVAADGRAIGFAGPAQAGKSTIAATFAEAGYSVLSDDLLVLSERGDDFWVEPGYSGLRLWPTSVEGLYGSRDALPRLVNGWEKRYVDLAARGVFCDQPLRLGAIYLIGPRRSAPQLTVEPVLRRTALLTLIANTYVGYLPGNFERKKAFEVFGRLLCQVPVRRIAATSDWESLSALPAAVLDDLAELACAQTG